MDTKELLVTILYVSPDGKAMWAKTDRGNVSRIVGNPWMKCGIIPVESLIHVPTCHMTVKIDYACDGNRTL